ncbi:hypothetical protein L3X38_032274 [Prunus dulcis]|uniref:Uncharacterized protein n=1 Tax=Prunus dulcis TaxID=3755 RepID=A0AAD4VFF6_PRUDU|nr:hypothetical protein L3X38_032274 [Prunus dulcis]
MPSHHSASVHSRLGKGKGHLYLELTKSQLLHISPLKDKPHEPMKVYKDCRDRLLDRQTERIPIPVNLGDLRVTDLGPPSKPTHLPTIEGVRDSDNWEFYNPED